MPDATLELSRRQPALRYWPAVLARAARSALDHDVPMLASALAYSTFFAVPATLLVVLGIFSLIADPAMIDGLMDRLVTIAPAEAVELIESSLVRLEQQPSAGVAMTIVGFVIALWATTGAMTTTMTAINRAHDRKDERGFVRRRVVALVLVLCFGSVALLVTGLLVLGPHLEGWVGGALGAETAVAWVWWSAQWPVLLAGLFGAFAMVFALATHRDGRNWRLLLSRRSCRRSRSWLAVSAAFSLYASRFGSYNKVWGSLSGVIVMLTWLWLSALALLYGAEVDAQAERSPDR